MKSVKSIIAVAGCLSLLSCGNNAANKSCNTKEEFITMLKTEMTSPSDLTPLFPKTVDEVKRYADWAIEKAQTDLDAIIALAPEARTFDNTARALDQAGAEFGTIVCAIQRLTMVSPQKEIRDACQEQYIRLSSFSVDAFSSKPLYAAFSSYAEKSMSENVNPEQAYFIQETMSGFKRSGLNLPDAEFEKVQTLKKELEQLGSEFDNNIAATKNRVETACENLAGIDPHVLEQFEKNENGLCVIECGNPPHVVEILDYCHHQQTRKDVYRAYQNRAFPANQDLMNKIIAKRHELAVALGFESFAALDLDDQMVKTPERAQDFIEHLLKRAQKKATVEFEDFSQELPEGIELNDEGLLNPWDFSYVKTAYKKKHYNLDERLVAEYFTTEKTLAGVFEIYQNFLGLEFKFLKPDWAWHKDVQLIEVHDKKSKQLRGYIFLDLYPRPDKYSHACHAGIISSIKKINEQTGTTSYVPSVAIVIANFPKPTKDRPALLKFYDVNTFFHEFGHAMHAVVGATELSSFSGTSVKCDFVEMPSQMFEEWLYDKDVLQSVSAHYKTGEPLPLELIDTLIGLKQFGTGFMYARQSMLALLSLEFFKEGANKDIDAISAQLARRCIPQVSFDPATHFYASFGHLTGYGAKYYSYSWSKVFALDIFEQIKKDGLANAAVGKRFAEIVLGKGGSVDPDEILKSFLGRAPSQEAFFKDLGM